MEKRKKSLYVGRGSSDFDEIWIWDMDRDDNYNTQEEGHLSAKLNSDTEAMGSPMRGLTT